jgi:hypothetical protein
MKRVLDCVFYDKLTPKLPKRLLQQLPSCATSCERASWSSLPTKLLLPELPKLLPVPKLVRMLPLRKGQRPERRSVCSF